jgi:hypothetical protein
METAGDNYVWGTKNIQGELRKLKIKVAKRTIQQPRLQSRPHRHHYQMWADFLQSAR